MRLRQRERRGIKKAKNYEVPFIWKGYKELMELQVLNEMPKIIAVQACGYSGSKVLLPLTGSGLKLVDELIDINLDKVD